MKHAVARNFFGHKDLDSMFIIVNRKHSNIKVLLHL